MSAHTHSSPNHAPAPKTPAPAESKVSSGSTKSPVAQVPPAVAETPTPTDAQAVANGPGRNSLLFAILLAIVGTLPIGLGIGMARRAANIAAAELLAKSKHKVGPVHDDTAAVELTRRNRLKADEYFRAREFRLALQLYQSNETIESLRHSEEVFFKIALCREALGQIDEALAEFRELSARDDSPFRSAALLGQGRIWFAKRELHHARAVLGQLSRTEAAKKAASPEAFQDARFFLAMTWLQNPNSQCDVLETPSPISPLSEVAWKGISLFNPNNIGADDLSKNDDANSDDEIASPTNASDAERFLEKQVELAPHHRMVGHAKLALGQFAYQRGDVESAVSRFEKVMSKSSDTVSLIAAYNSGVIHFQRGDIAATVSALGQVVDGAPGHGLVVPALILRGRAGIALGNVEQAAFDLKRAADISNTEDERSWATAFMGMAFLQARKQDVAAKMMFQRRDRITTEAAKALGGLVVALARLETIESVESRDRETLFLLRALANLNPDASWLGDCGRTLIGRAYHEVNLGAEMAETYSRALSNGVREPYASEMKSSLGEYLLTIGDEQEGLALLIEVREAKQSPWSFKSGMAMARWELSQHREQECLGICQELLRDDVDRASVLRLMGTAYEQTGNVAKAAECFAGLIR